MQEREYRVKRYEGSQMIQDALIHKFVDCGLTSFQVRAIKEDIIPMFEAVETIISKYSD